MRILTVTYLKINSDPRARKFAETLSENHEVHVLDLDESENTKGYTVWGVKSKSNPIISLFSFWLKIFVVAFKIKPDVIVAHNYYNVFPVYVVSALLGKKRVYDSYEFYVPSRSQKLTKRSHFFYLLEKVSVRRYKTIFSANIERSRLMKAKYGLKDLPIPILNISNPIFIKDSSLISLKEKYPNLGTFIDEGIVIVYQGYMSIERNIAEYLKILSFLPQPFKLLYVGGGPDLDKIRAEIENKKMKDRALAMGKIAMDDIIPLVKNCSYGIVTYPFHNYNNRYCSPNKIFEYSQAHIPFISSSQSTIRRIMHGVDYVCYIDVKDAELSANAIVEFNKGYLKNDSIFDGFNNKYNWSNEKKKITNAFAVI